jgi:hypothetical protein
MESFFAYLQKSPYNMMLFGGAIASGALLLWPLLMRPFRAGSEVSAFEAVQLIKPNMFRRRRLPSASRNWRNSRIARSS